MCDTPLEYKACGLDGIFLCNGYETEELDGEKFTYIKDVGGLHNAIALHLVVNRKTLAPREIRFIRVAMDETQSELGRLLGVTSQSVARWEKGQTEIPGPADRMIRLLFLRSLLQPDAFAEFFSQLPRALNDMDEDCNSTVQFRRVSDGWREAA